MDSKLPGIFNSVSYRYFTIGWNLYIKVNMARVLFGEVLWFACNFPLRPTLESFSNDNFGIFRLVVF